MEMERSNTFRCLFVWVVWSLSLVGSLWLSGLSGLSGFLGCLGCLEFIGSDFLTSIKKFFNFPNFFSNYLIFNAFQI